MAPVRVHCLFCQDSYSCNTKSVSTSSKLPLETLSDKLLYNFASVGTILSQNLCVVHSVHVAVFQFYNLKSSHQCIHHLKNCALQTCQAAFLCRYDLAVTDFQLAVDLSPPSGQPATGKVHKLLAKAKQQHTEQLKRGADKQAPTSVGTVLLPTASKLFDSSSTEANIPVGYSEYTKDPAQDSAQAKVSNFHKSTKVL